MTGNSISIDMSALHRPTASGTVLSSSDISVNFPDDKTYTAVLQAPNVIRWSNNSSWTKVAAIETVIDLNGKWMSGGVLGPAITVHGNSISIDMSALKRPTAIGTVVNEFGHLGKLSRRQDLLGRAAETGYDPSGRTTRAGPSSTRRSSSIFSC